MTNTDKPLEIIELENTYEITLNEVKSIDNLSQNTYVLDKEKRVIALDLSSNEISEIKGLENLTSLQSLNLSSNEISEIKSLENLTSLKALYLFSNQISEIKGLEKLTSLQTLDLSSNKISEIKSLEKLTSLQLLNLSFSQISEIKGLENLTSLQSLLLSYNQISEIKSLEKLTSLKTLYLFSNQISEIKSLEKLTSLKTLYLFGNQISEIKGLEKLTLLQNLYLSFNQISDIKSLENLSSLQILDLSDNQISDIKSLENLSSLQKLYLSDNQVSELDEVKKLFSLKKLEILRIYNNKFLETIELKLDEDYNSNNYKDVKLYLEGMENFKEYSLVKKIVLAGNHHSGKSTFLNNFLGKEEKSKSTHILDIVPYKKEKETKAIIYDFGGQDYYHGLYKAFMTNDSINLIFWKKSTNNNKESDDNSEENKKTQNFTNSYWIKQFSSINKNKQWLIQTHVGKGDDEDEMIALTDSKFIQNIFKQFNINAKDKEDIDFNFLKNYLEKEIDKELTIEKSSNDIEVEKYVLSQIGSEVTLVSNLEKKFPKSKGRIKHILTQLSRQGLVLYYSHIPNLEDVAWLNPSATLKEIHTKVFSKDSIGEYKGKIEKTKFKELLEKVGGEKIELMLLENKVIFLDESSDTKKAYYIVPSFLPKLNNDSLDYLYLFDMQTPFLAFKFEYFIPFGFINKLISEYGKTPDVKKYWKDMLLFTYEKETKIFIKLDFESLEIKLYVISNKDKSKRTLDEIKRNLFEDIIMFYLGEDFYESSLYKKDKDKDEYKNKYFDISKFDLPDDLYISLDETNYVHYNTLDDSEKTKESILSYKLKNNEIDKENAKTINTRSFKNYTIKNKEIHKMKKIFISYSRKDMEYRDELRKHLNMLSIFEIADNWACEDITIGKWESQIQKELEDSDLIIYMLSVNFFSSPYILYEEVIKGMELISQNSDKKILPIIVSDFIGLDKLNKKIENPNKLQEAILGLSHYQYLPYGEIENNLTNQKEERIISLKEYSNNNQLETALTQIVTKITNEM